MSSPDSELPWRIAGPAGVERAYTVHRAGCVTSAARDAAPLLDFRYFDEAQMRYYLAGHSFAWPCQVCLPEPPGDPKPAKEDVVVVPFPTGPVDAVVRALDSSDVAAGIDPHGIGLVLRVLKVTEEAGEAAAALIGTRGQNPRKGVTHTYGEAELFDVALTALVAAASVNDRWAERFAAHVEAKTSRLVESVEADRI